jgi:hypothetical protein
VCRDLLLLVELKCSKNRTLPQLLIQVINSNSCIITICKASFGTKVLKMINQKTKIWEAPKTLIEEGVKFEKIIQW